MTRPLLAATPPPYEAAHREYSLSSLSDPLVRSGGFRVSPCLYLDERRSPRGHEEHVRSRTVRQTHWRSRRLVRRWRCASTGSIPGWACATFHGFGGRLLLFLLLAEVHLSAGGWLPGGSKFLPFSPFLLSLSVFLSLPLLPFLFPPFFPSSYFTPRYTFSLFFLFYSLQPGHSARPTFANDQTRAPVFDLDSISREFWCIGETYFFHCVFYWNGNVRRRIKNEKKTRWIISYVTFFLKFRF